MVQKPVVIIIEDDERFRETLRLEFSDLGYRTASAESWSLLPALENIGYVWIAVDLRLARGSSLKDIPNMKQRFPDSRIVLMSGYGSIPSAIEAVRLGADDFLPKPFSTQSLIARFKGSSPATEDLEIQHPSLASQERNYIEYILLQTNGNISQAARKLGIRRQVLQRKLRKYSPV